MNRDALIKKIQDAVDCGDKQELGETEADRIIRKRLYDRSYSNNG